MGNTQRSTKTRAYLQKRMVGWAGPGGIWCSAFSESSASTSPLQYTWTAVEQIISLATLPDVLHGKLLQQLARQVRLRVVGHGNPL